MTLRVLDAGFRTLVEDMGRPRLASMGASRSGAFDRSAMHQANALLGNGSEAAGLEILGGTVLLQAESDHHLAVTGAIGSITIDGRATEHGRRFQLRPNQIVRIGRFSHGLRGYVAIDGGLDVPLTLGSRSADTLSGIGPAPVTTGELLNTFKFGHGAAVEDVPALLTSGDLTVRAIVGPRDDWFEANEVRRFLEGAWTVSSSSNRIGIRLEGDPVRRQVTQELPSEPCVRGSIQIAADGMPIIFGPDHPVTGGYPVIAVVNDADTDRLAQARPGQIIRFQRISVP